MWRRLVILLWKFLQYTQIKNFLMMVLPQETINPQEEEDDDFEKIEVEADFPKQKRSNKPWRILSFNGTEYVVGKELKESQGVKDTQKRTHDPIICQHPSGKMQARGGRNDLRWWCCQACGTRWDRIPLSKYEPTQTTQSSGKDLVTFGKHAGKTYDQVLQSYPGYCEWVMKTAEEGDDVGVQLIKFARYLATREARSAEDVPAGRMDEEL